MKKIIFLSLFIIFKMFGQLPKIEAVVSTTENIDGIRAVLNKTNPTDAYSAIVGLNKATNSFGYGVFGSHLGSGYGVYGQSVAGFAVAGFSSHIGVLGRGDIGGVWGQSITGKGVTGESSEGIGGHFESTIGYALITGTGNVGIGLSTPTSPLDINGRIRLRNNGGNNTSGIWYDSDAGVQRVFVGMETNDLFGFYGTPGWSFRFNATNGNIGISTVPTANKLEVNGSIGSSSLLSSGNTQLYANAAGTIINAAPIAFLAKQIGSPPSIPNSSPFTFPFTNEDYDLGGFFNTSNYEFSAPANGIYHFDAFVTFGPVASASSTSIYILNIYVDNAISSYIQDPMVATTEWKTLTINQDLKLNAGQKVKIVVNQTSGNSITLVGGEYNSKFSGHLVVRL